MGSQRERAVATTRRRVLQGCAGMLAAGTFAGCLGDGETADGYAMFFPIHDWAEQVAGEELAITNPVGTGRMGHGWRPDGTITTDIAATDIFLYLDSPDFAWAQNVAGTLESDYDDIVVVDLYDPVESSLIGGGEHDNEGNSGTGEDDQEGFADPHAWVDPVLAQEMVTKIAEVFANLDGNNAEQYDANAAAYRDRLAEVDTALEATIQDASLDVAVFAGHDSFSYIEQRYGFELVTPHGVSPDAIESIDDVAGLIDTIDEHGIDTVLYDPFEAAEGSDSLPQSVDLLLENTDATGAEPLTAISGTTKAWDEQGWGWVEQMEQVNIPSLEAALTA